MATHSQEFKTYPVTVQGDIEDPSDLIDISNVTIHMWIILLQSKNISKDMSKNRYGMGDKLEVWINIYTLLNIKWMST